MSAAADSFERRLASSALVTPATEASSTGHSGASDGAQSTALVVANEAMHSGVKIEARGMGDQTIEAVEFNPWPHRAARVLVGLTFPLIWIGGLVTTTRSGMAVEDWPTTFGHHLFLYPWIDWLTGPFNVLIEHGHRLLASVVGIVSIWVMVLCWKLESRPWVRRLALVVFAFVVFQGLLGGVRVLFDQRTMAMIHGACGHAFFGLSVSLACVTSRWWRFATRAVSDIENLTSPTLASSTTPASEGLSKLTSSSLARLALITTFFVYVQILLGAHLRHFHTGVFPHLALAAVVVFYVDWLGWQAWKRHRGERLLTRPVIALIFCVTLQLALGVAAWVTNRGWPAWLGHFYWAASYTIEAGGRTQIWLTTAHVAMGALILGIAVTLSLRSARLHGLDMLISGSKQAKGLRRSPQTPGRIASASRVWPNLQEAGP